MEVRGDLSSRARLLRSARPPEQGLGRRVGVGRGGGSASCLALDSDGKAMDEGTVYSVRL